MRPAQSTYEEPFFWWGPGWQAPGRAFAAGSAAGRNDRCLDWAQCSGPRWRGASRLVVVAGPSGAGKTTLLTALLEFLPPATRRIYLRGCFETFAFLSRSCHRPGSDGPAHQRDQPALASLSLGTGGRALPAGRENGFALMATAHAESVPEFVGLARRQSATHSGAARWPPSSSSSSCASRARTASGRRVTQLWRLRRTRDGVEIEDVELPPLRTTYPLSTTNQSPRFLLVSRPRALASTPAAPARSPRRRHRGTARSAGGAAWLRRDRALRLQPGEASSINAGAASRAASRHPSRDSS